MQGGERWRRAAGLYPPNAENWHYEATRTPVAPEADKGLSGRRRPARQPARRSGPLQVDGRPGCMARQRGRQQLRAGSPHAFAAGVQQLQRATRRPAQIVGTGRQQHQRAGPSGNCAAQAGAGRSTMAPASPARLQQGAVARQAGRQVPHRHADAGDAGHAVGVLARSSPAHAQCPRRQVTAQERKVGRRRRADLPAQHLAIRRVRPAIQRPDVRHASSLRALHHLPHRRRWQRAKSTNPWCPWAANRVAVFGPGPQEGDQLQIAAVGKPDQSALCVKPSAACRRVAR